MSENRQFKQEQNIDQALDQIHQTIIEFNINNNQRINSAVHQPYNRVNKQNGDFRPRRSKINPREEHETTVSEPPLPFYKHLTSVSIKEDILLERTSSKDSTPTTIIHLTVQTQDILQKNA